jgi:hypothetical protein
MCYLYWNMIISLKVMYIINMEKAKKVKQGWLWREPAFDDFGLERALLFWLYSRMKILFSKFSKMVRNRFVNKPV